MDSRPYFNRIDTFIRTEVRDFGILDAKGRSIGAMAEIGEMEFVVEPNPVQFRGYWRNPDFAGHWYTFKPGAMRGGQKFGAWQEPRMFRTAEERNAAMEVYFAKAAKRAKPGK